MASKKLCKLVTAEGYVDFKELGALLGVTRQELADVMHVNESTIRRGARSEKNQIRAGGILTVIGSYIDAGGTLNSLPGWFKAKQNFLKNKSVFQVLKKNKKQIPEHLTWFHCI